jgi:hypothetical protein
MEIPLYFLSVDYVVYPHYVTFTLRQLEKFLLNLITGKLLRLFLKVLRACILLIKRGRSGD